MKKISALNHNPQRFRQRILQLRSKIKNIFLAFQDNTTSGVNCSL